MSGAESIISRTELIIAEVKLTVLKAKAFISGPDLIIGGTYLFEIRGIVFHAVVVLKNCQRSHFSGVLVSFSMNIDEYMKAFWIKMAALALALLFTFAVRRRVVMADETRMSSIWNKLVAGVSLGLWGTVAVAGRWIGLP